MKSSLSYVEIVTRILLFVVLLIQREDQNPSPAHTKSKSLPSVMTRQEYTEKRFFGRSQRTSHRAVSDYYKYKIHSSK